MLIRNDQELFDTDEMLMIDRISPDLVMVTLSTPGGERMIAFKGIAAQQVWAAVTEHSNFIETIYPPHDSE